MDKLEQALRDDAAKIRAEVSPELDDRIRASLENVAPVRPEASERPRRPMSWWWTSSLTGVAAAIAVIAMINVLDREPEGANIDTGIAALNDPGMEPLALPEWSAHAAVMADPLEKELEDLESDLRKARDVVRRDLRLDL